MRCQGPALHGAADPARRRNQMVCSPPLLPCSVLCPGRRLLLCTQPRLHLLHQVVGTEIVNRRSGRYLQLRMSSQQHALTLPVAPAREPIRHLPLLAAIMATGATRSRRCTAPQRCLSEALNSPTPACVRPPGPSSSRPTSPIPLTSSDRRLGTPGCHRPCRRLGRWFPGQSAIHLAHRPRGHRRQRGSFTLSVHLPRLAHLPRPESGECGHPPHQDRHRRRTCTDRGLATGSCRR